MFWVFFEIRCHYAIPGLPQDDPPAPVSQVLRLQARIIILSSHSVLCAPCTVFPTSFDIFHNRDINDVRVLC